MKAARQKKILEIIGQTSVYRQEDLLVLLRESGFDVTQATISRDIRELRLTKTATGEGEYRYVANTAPGKPTHAPTRAATRFETIFRESVLEVDYAKNIVLVKCFSGMANAACELFDAMVWADVVGTLSGDDTFIIIMRSDEAAITISKQLHKYTNT